MRQMFAFENKFEACMVLRETFKETAGRPQ
jgi:hypothetical protein